jgi:hypothetical protein
LAGKLDTAGKRGGGSWRNTLDKGRVAEELLLIHLCELKLYPVAQYYFHPERRWRFDAASPHIRLAYEIEGGVWVRGRHSRGQGFIDDMEKYNTATMLGWRVLRFTPQQVMKGEAKAFIEQYMEDCE